ncbi:ribosomal protein S18-alanine N-acetyltransferase [Corynebacterium pelargi]|uniref:Ribosomal-protein-alanine N-acetyltransferase n=1 Tax=Corynebacterium pelargi TaxID=1471400 RepID=A0A410WAS4_9CORY|nr:ribosomal protein S18-alanine N-acetyltransferase [Corynebacterium pelargi]QAU53040.1 ribosomal-protein-alanine N-acetyltransferase [Corynebacterium pelargi]GGG75255.1 ribosomal-protein-alanine acetyltransferase [Corynebacterium pelargi]
MSADGHQGEAALRIRPLSDFDAPRLAHLEQQLFSGDNPWCAEDFRAEFSQPHTLYLGIELDQQLVAYAGVAFLGPAHQLECEIHTIGVDPAYQGRGLARAMMNQVCALADQRGAAIFLEVRTDNEPAIGLYEAFGFQRIGLRRNYYQPSGADAFTMLRPCSSDLAKGAS